MRKKIAMELPDEQAGIEITTHSSSIKLYLALSLERYVITAAPFTEDRRDQRRDFGDANGDRTLSLFIYCLTVIKVMNK